MSNAPVPLSNRPAPLNDASRDGDDLPSPFEGAGRIGRVVAALHRDLDRDWRLDDLAAIACWSPYHFHRIYRALQGETPDETLRRLRLHRAAVELIRSAADVERVARRAGYSSAAAFTRAFSSAYGRPPAAFRKQVATSKENVTMYEVVISQQPARRLVGLPHLGDYQQIGSAFERLGPLAAARGLRALGPLIGVYFDDPQSTPREKLRSFAGAPCEGEAAPPLETLELPAGRAASVIHKGPYARLLDAYDHLYAAWLPTSGEEPADSPCFEIYLNDPTQTPPTEWLTQVVMPLKG
jgi:AraC family transcriptional regulator